MNPFTRERQQQPIWTPDPDDTRAVPALPGASLRERLASLPHVELDDGFDAFTDLANAIATLLGEDEVAWQQRIGDPPALVNPRDEPYESHVWELPAPVLAALVEQDVDPMGELVRAMADLALHARQGGRRLYCWL